MRPKVTLILVALAGAALSLAAGADAQAGPLVFGACAKTQIVRPAVGLQCATLDVPFDRAAPAFGDIALAVQRVPASAPRQGTIVLLAGGPGQAALPLFESFLVPLAREPALRGFELVAFDQRGTGQSEQLDCAEAIGALFKGGLTSYFGACGTELGATRGFYTSQESVEDLDALRQALGGTPLSLFAVSYGGRVAGMYAREHRQGVARMVLDSPTPLDGPSPLSVERLRALRRVLDEGICGAGACHSFSADVYADLAHVASALRRHPMHTRIYDDHGKLRRASVTTRGVLRLLFALDVSPGARELAPAAIAAAAHGNAAPLARLAPALQAEAPGSALASKQAEAVQLVDSFSDGPFGYGWLVANAQQNVSELSLPLFAATYCDEDRLPWSPDSSPASRRAAIRSLFSSLPAGTTAPFPPSVVAATGPLTICEDWPATLPAPPSPTGVSAAPTLILSGEDDLRTSYEQDLTVAQGYSDAQLLRIPDTGHSTVTTDRTGCAKRAMIGFLATGQAPASCQVSTEPQALPLPPSSLSRVAPLPLHPRVVGRVAAAVAITLEDLFGQPGYSGGGMRGGFWQLNGTKIVVKNLVDIPGVTISGSISLRTGLAHFTVRGRIDGTLTQKGLSVEGRLGGMPVRLHLVAT